ncbi:MAG: sodium-translocating pyrophosphatase, partial [Armatimonadetes bacterium]|nr:sodium-translocating pyrophosphatase [Armatimonadota bacterium]
MAAILTRGWFDRLGRYLASACFALVAVLAGALPAAASEAELKLPNLGDVSFNMAGSEVGGRTLLFVGLVVCVLGGLFGLWQYAQIKNLPVHKSMAEMSELIYETCKTYLLQQGRFLVILEVFIGIIMVVYFAFLAHMPIGSVLLVLILSVVGILGSYSVAWFGVRINTFANSRTAFASLTGKPYNVYAIPLQAGMSIGVLLISLELIMMLAILLFIPGELAGACFVGFAIGESLGASALRICGGIFTKIADIGSDLMKIVFNIKEDDARNPGVIADCTGDNAGDSVGPTADGFETYGVTGVALISFIALAVGNLGPIGGATTLYGGSEAAAALLQSKMLVWIFVMRILMIATSIISYYINEFIARGKYANADKMDFEEPLTFLVWLTSIISIIVTFVISNLMLSDLPNGMWWKLSVIISCGTIAAAIIPELTKAFTSAKSGHVAEVVDSSREGGASLTILSGMVAGNFSAFWMGLIIAVLMAIGFWTSQAGLDQFMQAPAVFAFGLVAFGMLGMGPVTIAVDSYGPVTDNAQSIYELSLIETIPNVDEELKKDFGFTPQFEKAKHFLEENDGAGNTFKATAKPVLIGTAVVGATTMIFSIILLLTHAQGYAGRAIELVDPNVLLGLITGGATVFWFCGASMQAVTTGAYR